MPTPTRTPARWSHQGSHSRRPFLARGERLEDRTLLTSSRLLSPAVAARYQPVNVELTADDPAPFDPSGGVTFSVDWGDGSPATTVSSSGNRTSAGYVYMTDGSFTVRAAATDAFGHVGSASTSTVTVQSVVAGPAGRIPGSRQSLVVSGTPGDDTFVIEPSPVYYAPGYETQDPSYPVFTLHGAAVRLNGAVVGTVDVAGELSIYGGPGNDTFVVQEGVFVNNESTGVTGVLPMSFDGGDGSDTYDVNLGGNPLTPDHFVTVAFINDSGTSPADSDHFIARGTSGNDMITTQTGQQGGRTIWVHVELNLPNDEFGSTLRAADASGMEQFTLDAGAGNDTVHDPGGGTTILGGPGDDSITVTAAEAAGVVVDGGDGSDLVTVDLAGLAAPVTVADTGTSGSDAVAVVGAAGDNAVTLTGNQVQSGGQSVNLLSPVASLSVAGDVGSTQLTITGFTAPVAGLTVTGQGATSVVATDLGSSAVQSLTVRGGPDPNANQVVIVGTPPPSLSVQHLAPTVATVADVSTPQGSAWSLSGSFSDPDADEIWTAAVDYGDGSGSQPLDLSANKSFVLGHVFGENGDYPVIVTVTDSRGGVGVATFRVTARNVPPSAAMAGPTLAVPGQPRTYTLSATDPSPADRSAGFTYTVDFGDGTPAATIPASDGNGAGVSVGHVFIVTGAFTIKLIATDSHGAASAVAMLAVTVGTAQLQPDPLHTGQTLLAVGGTPGDDKIKIKPGKGSGELKVTLRDDDHVVFYRRTFDPVIHRIAVYGQAGDDEITVDPDVTIPAWLYGDDGDDKLKGGGGPSVELGGNGDDLLVGAGGRDLMIGGDGSDRIVGDTGDDILIAGTTAFDAVDTALAAVLAEWTSARSYAARVANLKGVGTGPRDNGAVFLITEGPRSTVFDDGEQDLLTGGAGQDWFLFNVDGDGDRGKKDRATDLSAAEFADDLDFINGA